MVTKPVALTLLKAGALTMITGAVESAVTAGVAVADAQMEVDARHTE